MVKLRSNVFKAEKLQIKQGKIPLCPEELIQFLSFADGLKVQNVKDIILDELNFDWIKKIMYFRKEN